MQTGVFEEARRQQFVPALEGLVIFVYRFISQSDALPRLVTSAEPSAAYPSWTARPPPALILYNNLSLKVATALALTVVHLQLLRCSLT